MVSVDNVNRKFHAPHPEMRNLPQVKTLDDHIAAIKVVGPWSCWKPANKPGSVGYVQVCSSGKRYWLHRAVYQHLIGPILPGLQLDHLCRRTWCCNPNHVEPVTGRVNTLRGAGPTALNAQKTACPKRHQFTDENTYIDKTGRRHCRICSRDAVKRYRKRLAKKN